jgi:HK97 family phage prohead protease
MNKTIDKPKESEEQKMIRTKAFYDHKEKLAIASTDATDRMGEVIDQTGWQLKNYKQNNVILFAHNDREIMVGNAINTRIDKSTGKPRLVFTPDFHEETDTARALKRLYEQGRMKTFSVGFMPIEFDPSNSTYTKQELLEISAVNVPANPDAQMLAYRSLKDAGFKDETMEEIGISTKVLDRIDKLEKTVVDLQSAVNGSPSQSPDEVLKRRQALSRTITKATDLMLAGTKHEKQIDHKKQLLKIVKRASELITTSQREEING